MGQKAEVKDPQIGLQVWLVRGALDAHGNQVLTSGISDSDDVGDVWELAFLRALQTDRMCSQEWELLALVTVSFVHVK